MLIQLAHKLVRRRLRRLGIESRQVEVAGCSLHYYEYRHPNPRGTLLLLHGLGTSSSTWFHLYPFLIKEHSVVALDLPGFGFSTVSNGRRFLFIDEHRTTLERFVDRLGLDAFTLVGHSLGGWIATKYAAAHPQRVSHLVLINTAGVYVDGVDELLRAFDVRTTDDMQRLVDTMWYRYPWYFKLFLPAFRSELVRRSVPEFVRSIRREDFFDGELQRLTMPAHLLWGIKDRLISTQTIRVLKEQLPQLQIEYIDACGHVPQLKNPEAMVEIFRKILQRKDQKESKALRHTSAAAL